jgi:two-component system sensor histidine kinase ChiS
VLVKDLPVTLEVIEETEMPDLHGDPLRLRQVIWNLVSNALKFTEEGSVRICLDMLDDEMAVVTVADTGIGMSQDGLDVIFERFSQVDGSSTRRAGGTGLGLTITKQLIEMHGGQVEVESEEGVGTTFRFTLPVYAEETLTEEA